MPIVAKQRCNKIRKLNLDHQKENSIFNISDIFIIFAFNMKATKKQSANIVDFPEEITSDGVKIYGETSYEDQIAILKTSL